MTPKSRRQRRQDEGERRQQRAASYDQAGAERDRAENVALQLVVIRAFRVTASLNLGRHVQRFDHETSFTPSGLRRHGAIMGRFSMRGAAQPAAAVSARPRFPAVTKALSRRRKLELCAISSMPSSASSTEQLLAKRPGYQTSQTSLPCHRSFAGASYDRAANRLARAPRPGGSPPTSQSCRSYCGGPDSTPAL
jgi:hypothetical protein